MRVTHITFSANKGGAGIAVKRLHNAMIEKGIESEIISFSYNEDFLENFKLKNYIYNFSLYTYKKIESNILRIFRPIVGAFSLNYGGLKIHKLKKINQTNIIYIHWINNNFISLKSLAKIIKTNKKVVIFLHDMWFLTGGCHHSFGCNKYESFCFKCPNLTNNFILDLAKINFSKKKYIYSLNKDLIFISPSKWMLSCAINGGLTKNFKNVLIPNFVDTNIFKPIIKNQDINLMINLHRNKKILLFGAENASTNPFKGWNLLKESLKILNLEIYLFTFGDLSFEKHIGTNITIINFGYLNNEKKLIELYNSVDLFLMPSLAESFGQSAIESLSCGTPVVAFNIGGLKDIIIHKYNGYLAKENNINDFADGIKWVLKNERKLINNCRNSAVSKFSKEKIINSHINLINRITNK